jgi:hypothetical protein
VSLDWVKCSTWGQTCHKRLLTHSTNRCYLSLWGIKNAYFVFKKKKLQWHHRTLWAFENCQFQEAIDRRGDRAEGSIRKAKLFLISPPQGMLALVLNCIDRLNIYNSVAHFAGIVREESGMAWKEILNLLYKLLGEYSCSASHQVRCARLDGMVTWNLGFLGSHLLNILF